MQNHAQFLNVAICALYDIAFASRRIPYSAFPWTKNAADEQIPKIVIYLCHLSEKGGRWMKHKTDN